MAGKPRKFGKVNYYEYAFFSFGEKRMAKAEAKRLRATGKWLVRLVTVGDGYQLYTRQKGR